MSLWYWICNFPLMLHTIDPKSKEDSYPFYIKAPAVLLGLVLFLFILRVLGDILVPLVFSGLFAILLNPLYTRLERRIPKIPAILLSILIAIVLITGLFYFLSTQIAMFSNS